MRNAALAGAVLGAMLLAGCAKQPAEERVVMDDPAGSPAITPPSDPPRPSAPVAIRTAPQPAPSELYRHIQANGTEPFWAIEVLPGQLRFSSPDQPSGVTFAATSGDGLHFAGRMNGTPVTLVLAPGLCSDGMSDRRYPYSASATIGAQSLHGCARAD